MSKVARIILLALLALALVLPGGTVAAAAQPPAPLAQGGRPLDQVPAVTMPAVDVAALVAEDEQRYHQGLPPRFAQPIPVQITPATDGIWESLPDGTRLWRLRIVAPGALSLNFGFTRYHLPAGARLFLYTPDYQIVRGPFTAADNEAHGQFWSPILLGDEIVVEVSLPAAAVPGLELALTAVNHGYREFGKPYSPDSGNCNLDVVCSAADGYPQVDAWRDQIRSVAVISTGGSTFCTGFLVNNVEEDLKGYFMTANHCGINAGNAASLVTYWNYQNSWCRVVGSWQNGQPGDGQLNQFNTGSVWRASYSASDFTLVELDDPINPDYNVHWAGWNATPADATSAVAIHHPNTDEKRISFEYDPTSTTSYLGTSVPGDGTHTRVTDWDLGTTEPGSSGSPLFDQEHHVVGQLHGGYAACGNNDSDWYGRFSVSWNRTGSNPTNRLKDWLDPGNTGTLIQDGRDLIEAPFSLAVLPEEVGVCAPDDALYDVGVGVVTPGFSQPVDLSVVGNPPGTTAVFDADPVLPPTTTTLTIGNTGAAPEGSYDLDVAARYSTSTITVTVELNLYAGPPLAPGLLTPADGATDQALQPDLTWQPGSLTGQYNLQVDRSPLFGAPLIDVTGLDEPAYTPDSPLDGGLCYWWRVQGDNTCGEGDWALPFHFATASMTPEFFDDVEAGNIGWTAQSPWAITAEDAHSGTHSWTDSPGGAYGNNVNTALTSPVLDLSGAATVNLSFWQKYVTESGYDYARVEYSVNGGGSWTQLVAYEGDSGGWVQAEFDLPQLAGQANARIRFRLTTDGSVTRDGWHVDDVLLTVPMPPNPAPTVESIVPNVGQPGQPTPVTVTGSGFIDTPVLKLDDTWLLNVTQVNSTTLTAVVPGLPVGVYDLTLYNGDCQEVVLPEAFVVGGGCISPTAAIESDSPGNWGEPLHFVATVGGTTPMTYTWEFGGAGQGSGLDGPTPAYTYTLPGQYTVTLTVENDCGQDTASLGVAVVAEYNIYLPLLVRN